MERRKKVKDIAHDFGVGLTAVYNWINIYEMKGINGLNLKKAPERSQNFPKRKSKNCLTYSKKPQTIMVLNLLCGNVKR